MPGRKPKKIKEESRAAPRHNHKHKRYKELADYDPKNSFDVEKYMKHELVMTVDDEFEMYEIDVEEEDESSG